MKLILIDLLVKSEVNYNSDLNGLFLLVFKIWLKYILRILIYHNIFFNNMYFFFTNPVYMQRLMARQSMHLILQ